MPDSLHAVSSDLAGVHPVLDGQGNIVSLSVDVNLSYADANNTPVTGRMVSIDAWSLLSDQQKANMQDIQSTLMAYIIATYFT